MTQASSQVPFILPHFDYEVPLLTGSDGLHYVPVGMLCRMLGLNPTDEIQRARHILLWSHAELLPLTLVHRRHTRTCFAWCLPYPLPVGYWYGQVDERVHDPARRQQLDRALHEAMELNDVAERHVRTTFEVGRRRMFQLVPQCAELRARASLLAGRAVDDHSLTGRRQVALATYAAVLADEVEPFVRAWIADVANLPVIDAIRVDAEGHVLEQDIPMSLFGVLTHEDAARLTLYEQLTTHALADLAATIDPEH